MVQTSGMKRTAVSALFICLLIACAVSFVCAFLTVADEDDLSSPMFRTGLIGICLLVAACFLDRRKRFWGIGCATVVIVASFLIGYVMLPGW